MREKRSRNAFSCGLQDTLFQDVREINYEITTNSTNNTIYRIQKKCERT
jgi:hypothetical protein